MRGGRPSSIIPASIRAETGSERPDREEGRSRRPGYTVAMDDDDRELSYYRSVEDLFSSLRGAPHVLSPRDFQLLRSWWRDEVPMAAVTAGLTEVFARQRERDDADPVVSLSYCRHAVKRNAKRLAEMHIGRAETDSGDGPQEAAEHCRHLVAELNSVALEQRSARPVVAEALTRIADQVETAGRDLSVEMLDEHLFGLESTMLHECWQALARNEQQTINERVEAAVEGSSASKAARQRSARALRDREVRLLLHLPRLEFGQ